MDPTEDLSARVLLQHILTAETTRSPITRSTSKRQSTTGTRRNTRSSNKDAGGQNPQDLLRRSMKHKMRESISRKSMSPTKSRASRKTPNPALASQLFDEGDTPRHIFMNILRTEPVNSPVVHKKASSEEPQLPSASSSFISKRPSVELSGLELPDITIGNAASTAKGLSRKRPRHSLNVTAFEKRLQDGGDVENEESIGDHSSLSLSSSTSLSLKTPFVDVRTEKRGLQRRVSNRRKITEEEFGAAVNKRHMEGVGSVALAERGLSETTHCEGFTLGLTKLSEPDITADIINCNTALYAQTDVMITSNLSQSQSEEAAAEAQNEEGKYTADCQPEDAVAMSESEDVAESQTIGRNDTAESEEEENQVKSQTEEEGAADSQTEEDVAARSQSEEEENQMESQTEEEGAADSQTEEDVAARSQSEEEENQMESQTEEEGAADSQTEEDVAARSQSDEEENQMESQTEEEGAADSQTEEDVAARSQSEEEENQMESQTEEEGAADSQTEDDVAARSQSEEEENQMESQTEEEGAADSQTEEDVAARSQSEEEEDAEECQSDQQDPAGNSQSEEEDGVADSQTEDENDGKQTDEHISRMAHRCESRLIRPVTQAEGDLPDATEAGMSKAHSASGLHSGLETGGRESSRPHIGIPDLTDSSTQGFGQNDTSSTEAEPDADKDNYHPPELMHDIEDSGHMSDASLEEAAASDPAEQEEWEDEEDDESEESPMKTPAFVKEKRNFFLSDPLASPTASKNIQASDEGLPQGKTKQVRRRRSGPAKRETGLPKSYLMGVFKHFAKTKVSADVYPVLKEIVDKFFDRMVADLEVYALHAKRKTIEVEDVELLLKRQGYVNDKVPVEVLIEKYLRMDQRKLLIPIATSGNVVIPKKRR